MKLALIAFVFLALSVFASTADAQKTCTPVTTGTQNCVATITWSPGIPDATHPASTGFTIRRSDGAGPMTEIGKVVAPTTSFQNTFTDAGNVAHCWEIVGTVGSTQSGPSTKACWTTPALAPAAPNAPGTPVISSITRDSMQVTWTDNSTTERGFALIRKYGSRIEKIFRTPADSVAVLDGGLRSDTTYRYVVAAYDDNGFSDVSGEAVGRTRR